MNTENNLPMRFNPKNSLGTKKKTLYDEVSTTRDSVTGEIIETARRSIGTIKKQDEFLCVYMAGLTYLTKQNLTMGETKTLFELFKYTVNNSNMISLSSDIRKIIAKDSKLKEGTVRTNIKKLKDKELLIVSGSTYFLNPLYFGRGGWEKIKTLRQDLRVEYNFETLEAVEKISSSFAYQDDDNILSSDNIEIDDIYDNGDLQNREQEMIISSNISNDSQIIDIETENNEQLIAPITQNINELELLNAQIEAKKLDNEEKRLEIELLQTKIEAKKLGLI